MALEVSGLLGPEPTGVGSHGAGLIEALWRLGSGRLELTGLVPWGRWRRRASLVERFPSLPLCRYLGGGRLSRRCDLVHALDTRTPRSLRGPLVATIFDLFSLSPRAEALGFSPARFRRRKQAAYARILRRAQAIVTLSEAVRQELEARFSTLPPVVVIPPGVAPPLGPPGTRALEALRRLGLREPYLLSVGALCPRKNLAGVLEAHARARARQPSLGLALVGAPAHGWTGSEAERRALGSPGVILTGYLSPSFLWAAYQRAAALLTLSLDEGFGLTALEALSVGTPVVASRRGGLPEACGGAAWLVDPDDAAGAAAAIGEVLEGSAEVELRRAAGQAHAARLTWARTAEKTVELYREVLGG